MNESVHTVKKRRSGSNTAAYFSGLSRTVVFKQEGKRCSLCSCVLNEPISSLCEECSNVCQASNSKDPALSKQDLVTILKNANNPHGADIECNSTSSGLSKEDLVTILFTAQKNASMSHDLNDSFNNSPANDNCNSSSSQSGTRKRKKSDSSLYPAKRLSYSEEDPDSSSPKYPPKQNKSKITSTHRNNLSIHQETFVPTNYEGRFQCQPSLNESSDICKLSDQIWDMYWSRRQSEEVFNMKMSLRSKLHEILLHKFHNCGLYVVGSSMTGLGDNNSDMDMCLMLSDSEIDQKRQALQILYQIRRLLEHKFLRNIQVIPATVPIIRFTDRVSGVEVDLNINNSVGIRNTQLLSSYARIEKRFPPMVVLAKQWAKVNNINDAKNNSLSSYTIVLMVVHYLQYRCNPPVLPCLQELQKTKFMPNTDIRNLKLHENLPAFISQNKKTVGELFVGFLKYYAEEFNYASNVICVRLGTVLPRDRVINNQSPKNKKSHWKFLCVEEPFDKTNTARSIFNEQIFEYIKYVFRRSFGMLKDKLDLRCLL